MRRLLPIIVAVAALLATAGVATAQRSQRITGTAWIGVTHTEGSTAYVSGDFKTNKLFGRGAVVFVTSITPDTPGTFQINATKLTFFTVDGTTTGTGKATLTTNPDGTGTVTGGTFSTTRGTGKYRGHRFKGTFAGTLANGIYTVTLTGTYK